MNAKEFNMKFKPSAIEEFIATLPNGVQAIATRATNEERDRWERGDLTEEENGILHTTRRLGKAAAIRHEKLLLIHFSN